MSEITVVANIITSPDKIDFVKNELKKLVDITRTEEGCLKYDLHQDGENPAHFMFYEKWESDEFLDKHINSQHLKNYAITTEGMIKTFTVNKMIHVL